MGPGALEAERLLARCSAEELSFALRWGAGNRDFWTGFLFGKFINESAAVILSNAARALAAGELDLTEAQARVDAWLAEA